MEISAAIRRVLSVPIRHSNRLLPNIDKNKNNKPGTSSHFTNSEETQVNFDNGLLKKLNRNANRYTHP